MRTIPIAISCALIASAPAALAQDVLGTSVVKGKTVELLSDYTWRYKDAPLTTTCRSIKYTVTFCGENTGGKYSTSSNSDAAAVFQHDDSDYGEFIVEQLGANKGITMEAMRAAVLGNAANFSGQKPEDIVTVSDEPTVVDGFQGETLVYTGVWNKLPFVFYNTIVILPEDTAQIATFSIGAGVTDEGRRLHRDFVEQTHLK